VELFVVGAKSAKELEHSLSRKELVVPLSEEEHGATQCVRILSQTFPCRSDHTRKAEDGCADPLICGHQGQPQDGAHRQTPVAHDCMAEVEFGERLIKYVSPICTHLIRHGVI